MLLFGRLGDILGKTSIFMFGITFFYNRSLLCGITYSLGILLTARIIPAAGAAGMMANSQGIITHVLIREWITSFGGLHHLYIFELIFIYMKKGFLHSN